MHDVVVNPDEPQAHGRAYFNECTKIGFTISNIGGAATQLTDDLVVYFLIEGEIVETRILNNKGATPQLVLNTNDSVRLSFEREFSEGSYAAEIRVGICSLKGYSGGEPVYGLGDPFLGNNGRPFQVYCAPARGSIIGRVFSNPSGPGEGIDGIRVRLSGLHRTMETVSAYDAVTGSHGIYRFERVYPGDYMVEYLTDAPTNNVGPRYYPRSIHFRHDFGVVTDLRDGSGLFMRQYQRLHGRVRDSDANPVPDARITLGDNAFVETYTDAGGFFVITNVPPSGSFVAVVDHPDFLMRRVQFDMDVSSTAQMDTYPSGYFSLPDMTWIGGYTITMEKDTEPPVVELLPFENDGRRGNPLLFQFHGSDQNGRCAPAEYRWQVRNTGGTVLLQGPWTPWPTNAPPGNVASAIADLSSLSDFTYSFRILARDRARNESITAAQTFTLDKTPPQITVTVAESASIATSRLVPVDIAINNTEPGTLMLELSNDGTRWSEPWYFSGSAFHVSDWELTHREAYSGPTITVRARVTDAVGLQTIANDNIQLATVGAVRLAGGWEAWTNTVVPLLIDIVPPDGVRQKQLPPWADTIKAGGDPLAHYRAQAFVLTNSITFNRIRLGLFRVVGEPAPLTLRVVNTLDNADPTGEAGAVWSWTGTAEGVRLGAMRASDGMPPATSGDGTVLPAGTNYVIFVCDEVDPDNYYEFHAGRHRYNGDGGLRHDHNGAAWVVGPENPPGMGVPTFTLSLYHSPNGEIRICTDGELDSEPWVAFSYPEGRLRTVNAPGEGLFTTIVAYSNAVDTSRNGTHYDSVIIDFTPPVVHDISILSIDTAARGVLLNLDVTDAVTRVAGMRWRFDLGPWQVDPFRSKPFLYCPPSFSTMTWSFYDAAGNETSSKTFSLPVDMSAPTLTALIEDGRDYTTDVVVQLEYTADDDTAVDHITLRESRTDTVYNSLLSAKDKIPIELPQVIVGWKDDKPRYEHVDGTYTFELVAYDSSGNASEPVLLPITLDRERPRLDAVELTGARGEAPVCDTNLVLRLRVEDNLGPMEMRWRWQGGTWSAWQPSASGQFGLPLAGFLPLPRSYAVDVQVRDVARWTVSGSANVAVNRPPYTPIGIRPDCGTGDPPFLFGSDFCDPDNDPWGASQFAVCARGEIVLDTGMLHGADRYHVPAGWLQRGEKYQWRCRYFDPYGAPSLWSEWMVFGLHEDSDGDGIPDDIEQQHGTDWNNPDTDGDGIPDGLEDLNANGIVDEGETNPRLQDSDRDGLDDGDEDLNLNGRLDSDETSPWLPDTDSDGASDLHERRSGTDPRDSASLFRITGFQQVFPDGRRRLVWQARDGYSYEVLAHTNLSGAVPPQVVTNITAKGGFPPWYVVPLQWTEPAPSVPTRFYSIRLKE